MSKFYGSITREIEGEEYRLVLDFNAICHFEEATGSNFFERAEAWQAKGETPSAQELRAVIHAALSEHHPDKTAKDAGKIISTSMDVFADLMAQAMKGVEVAPAGKKRKAAA